MKTTSKTAVAAFAIAIASFASQAQAYTEIRTLPKGGVTYAVPHEEPRVQTTKPVHKVRHNKHATRHAQLADSTEMIL